MRNKKNILFLILFLSVSFPFTGCYPQNEKSASIGEKKQDPYSWDFGQAKQGEILKHAFILKNESQKTLTIGDVTTSCGCTVSKVEKKKLSPGEATNIEVQFNTKGYSGGVQQYIYVTTDDIDNPVIKLIIKAEVIK